MGIDIFKSARVFARIMLIMIPVAMVLVVGIQLHFFNSEPYAIAIEAIEKDVDILTEIGSVVSYGYMVTGKMKEHQGSGDATFDIRVNGSQKSIVVTCQLKKDLGEKWQLVDMKY